MSNDTFGTIDYIKQQHFRISLAWKLDFKYFQLAKYVFLAVNVFSNQTCGHAVILLRTSIL